MRPANDSYAHALIFEPGFFIYDSVVFSVFGIEELHFVLAELRITHVFGGFGDRLSVSKASARFRGPCLGTTRLEIAAVLAFPAAEESCALCLAGKWQRNGAEQEETNHSLYSP